MQAVPVSRSPRKEHDPPRAAERGEERAGRCIRHLGDATTGARSPKNLLHLSQLDWSFHLPASVVVLHTRPNDAEELMLHDDGV